MGATQVIKKSVLDGFRTDIGTIEMVVVLGFAVLCGLYIYAVYRFKTKTQFYSRDFNVSLLVLPVITAAIVLALQSNIVISLGMVGALSIVRFRNAVKNTIDLMFLFWAIGLGIIVGAGLFEIAIVLALLISILLVFVDFIPEKKAPYLLVLNCDSNDDFDKIKVALKESTSAFNVKSHSIRKNTVDIIIEIRCKDTDVLLKSISRIESVSSLNLLQHDGSVRV